MSKYFSALILFSFMLLTSCNVEPKKSSKKTVFDYNFLWNFSEPKYISYSYEMTSIDTETYVRDSAPHTIKTEIVGDMVITSQGKRTGTLSTVNLTKTIYDFTDKGEWSPAKPQSIGTNIVGELKQYSQFNNTRLDAIWDAYLPLPLEEIKEGESYELSMKLPEGMENNKYVRGFNTLTFKGYETIQNRKCIVLTGNIEVKDSDELEFEGEVTHYMTGNGTYYFDPKEHIYVKAEVETTLVRKVDSGIGEDIKKDLFLDRTINETFKIELK
ncbi:MAG: hypothetical protein ACPGVD_05645 [Flavobacteriales bacterium]